jgi:hypothetical protein
MNAHIISCEYKALWCEEKAAANAHSGKRSRRYAARAVRHAFRSTQQALHSPERSQQRTLFRRWAERWIALATGYAQEAERSERRSGKLQEAAYEWRCRV